jgi:hypothetical protein
MDDRVSLAERRLEELAREVIKTISEAEDVGQPGIRTELRDFTIGLLNDGLETSEPVVAESTGEKDAPVNPLGMALPVVIAAGVLLLLFPPVGVLLFGVAAVMVVWGLIASLVRR